MKRICFFFLLVLANFYSFAQVDSFRPVYDEEKQDFLICTTAVAQMDNDGNSHWDELYQPNGILELGISLPVNIYLSKQIYNFVL